MLTQTSIRCAVYSGHSMKIKQLVVTTPQGPAGDIHRQSQYVFNYVTKDPSCAVSLLMPLRAESYSGNQLPPIFSMSLPEGFLHERIIQRLAKFEEVDDMRLLSITGNQTIGRLQYAEPNAAQAAKTADIGLKQLLSERSTDQMFEHLVDTYLESGISGAQPKVMMPDADRPMTNRATVLQSNLIVKSGGVEYPQLSANEFLCMDAARRAGIEVPKFWLSDNSSLFVMERFDLRDDTRLGFEDMTVLMDQHRESTGNYKYRRSYEDIVRVIQMLCRDNAAESTQRFYEYFVLSVAVRNGDAHLKNFGLLYEHPQAEAPSLSPLYDVVTTAAYDDINTRTGLMQTDRTLALKLNKSKNYPTRAELITFGKNMCHVKEPEKVIERIGEAMVDSLTKNRDRVETQFFRRLQAEWEGGLGSISPVRVHVSQPQH